MILIIEVGTIETLPMFKLIFFKTNPLYIDSFVERFNITATPLIIGTWILSHKNKFRYLKIIAPVYLHVSTYHALLCLLLNIWIYLNLIKNLKNIPEEI